MLLRLSIIPLLLVTHCSFAMDYVEIELQERESETTGRTNRISSLQSWRAVARDYESIDGFDVTPEAVAQFQQKYEIKTDLPVAPWVPQLWLELKYSDAYPDDYNAEVARMHACLRGGEDTRLNKKLASKKEHGIKKAYQRLNVLNRLQSDEGEEIQDGRSCGKGFFITCVVLVAVFLAELSYLAEQYIAYNVNTTIS